MGRKERRGGGELVVSVMQMSSQGLLKARAKYRNSKIVSNTIKKKNDATLVVLRAVLLP